MQSTLKLTFVVVGALLAGAGYLSASPQAGTTLSCHANGSKDVNASVGGLASNSLGENYLNGAGVEQDMQQAYRWFCNGAMQRNSTAQLNTALMLLEGRGVQRDVQLGMSWLNQAAINGNHDAELALGILLVDSDPVRSSVLFKRSAAAGNLYANHRLAELYYYGIGVNQDYAKATELLEVGVAAGFDKSRDLLTRIRVRQNDSRSDVVVIEPATIEDAVAPVASSAQEPEVADAAPAVAVSPQQTQRTGNVLEKILSVFPALSKPSTAPVQDVEVAESTASSIKTVAADEHDVAPAPDVPETSIEVAGPAVAVEAVAVKPVVTISEDLEQQLVDAAEAEVVAEQTRESVQTAAQPDVAKPEPVKPRVANEPAKAAVKKVASSLNAERFFRDKAWVDAQPKMRYAIQLVQASTVEGVIEYIDKYDLGDKAFFINARQDGRYRYVLLYGDYPNNRTSKKMAKTLPQGVQDAGYWIRTYGNLRTSYEISQRY